MSTSRTVYCIQCDKKIEYTVKSQKRDMSVRGVNFSYVEQVAYCPICGEEVYAPAVNDHNVWASENAYRKAARLITVEEIQQILKKYDIGAEPLAKLLGFGEVTITRYIAGRVPSKSHSDLLLEVLSSYKAMEKYLKENGDRITPVAYDKCQRSIDRLSELYGRNKIQLITRYILSRAVEITPLALQKLLYYSQAFYYALYRTVLFPDRCQAWVHGPVYPDIYYLYREFGYNPIEKSLPEVESDFSELTVKELRFLDTIVDVFGMYSGQILSEITHREKPWIEARGDLPAIDRSVAEINQNTVNAYFDQVVEKYQIINPGDISRYCAAMIDTIG